MTTCSVIFMRRALDLAAKGGRDVMPNPQVGCVIVHEGNVIGEGWHKKYGEAHAEVNAINDVQDKELLKQSTLYVTLEPCSHFGKTPPCADLIIKTGIPKVVIASVDPNPIVAGNGINKLINAGVEVESGILDAENRELNARFFTFHEKKRPYVILKWAQSADGFLDKIRKSPDEKPRWITDEFSRTLVHKWRAREQAIMAGAKTILKDNPKLNVRNWPGKDPVRFALTRKTVFPYGYNLLDGSTETYIITDSSGYPQHQNTKLIVLQETSVLNILNRLYQMNIQSLFVEGGADTLQFFIDSGLWDEARVFTGMMKFRNGVKAPAILSEPKSEVLLSKGIRLQTYQNEI